MPASSTSGRATRATTAAKASKSSSSSSSLKRPADTEDANQSNNVLKKVKYSSDENKKRREVEMVDLESSMAPYDWQKPSFPVSKSAPRLKYINSGKDASLDSLLAELLKKPSDADSDDSITLGFDMEWAVDFRKGGAGRTALMQICSRSLILILHITHMVPEPKNKNTLPALPAALEALLCRSDVLKTGVNIGNDGKKLQGEFKQTGKAHASSSAKTGRDAKKSSSGAVTGIAMGGLLELSYLAQQIDPERWSSYGRRLISLRELSAVYLGRKLIKDGARTSNWSQQSLSKDQLKYAASDVMVGLEIYEAIRRRAKAKTSGSGESLDSLRLKRDCDTIEGEGRGRGGKLAPLKDVKNLPSKSAALASPSKKESQVSATSDGKGKDANSQAAESQDTQCSDPGEGESQKSTSGEVTATGPVSLLDAIRASTSNLSEQPVAPVQPSQGKQTANKPFSTSVSVLSYQRTFDLWMAGTSTGEKPNFHEISKMNKIQPNTAAGYVLKSFSEEDRHAPGAAGQEAGSAPVPTDLKERLARDLSDELFKPTLLRYKWWLEKHSIIDVPAP
ncbi:hypothetical protein A4X09_0g1645 [Tilletia walkeri]|uniref:3'-5' exonuclease domain-containing protein n=1 Tax=Tilletia walkeri TaxID=117179 RepID=A0A8X7NCT7_9BASI|nr:hypothetical protein A4X09_0g1645 [Tilletia walkeri]